MGYFRVNTLKDHCAFFLHMGTASAITAGIFLGLGTPLILGGIAVAVSAGLNLGLVPYIKSQFQEALDEERADVKRRQNPFLRRLKRNLGLDDPTDIPDWQIRLSHKAESWIRDFAERTGLKTPPHLLIMAAKSKNSPEEEGLKAGIKELLREKFNKKANAFAFSDEEQNVVLTAPIAQALNDREVKAVIAHEVGHLAADHNKSRNWLSFVSSPVKILTSLNYIVTAFSSYKNFALHAAAGVLSVAAGKACEKIMGLDPETNDTDKAKINTLKSYVRQGSLGVLAVAFQAPDLLLAMGLNFVTQKTMGAVEKSYSRRNEFQADWIAGKLTKDPDALCSGLKKVRAHYLKSEPELAAKLEQREKNPGLLTGIFQRAKELQASHPNIARRCARLANTQFFRPVMEFAC